MVKLPNKLRIGSIDFKIKFPCEFISDCETFGSSKQHIGLIEIRDTFSATNSWTTLMHEIVHEIDNAYLGGMLSEFEVNTFALALIQFIIDNDYKFKDDYIPKTIKVGTTVYNIKYPHRFTDNVLNSVYFDPNTTSIYLSDQVVEVFSPKYIKYILTSQIIDLILKIEYFKYYDFERFSDKDLFPLESFTTGIICLFRDNPKLESTIRKVWI